MKEEKRKKGREKYKERIRERINFDTNSQCRSHTVNVDNSPTHLSDSSSEPNSATIPFCSKKNKSHRSVEGRWRFGVEVRVWILRFVAVSFHPPPRLHLESPNLDTLVNVSRPEEGGEFGDSRRVLMQIGASGGHCFPQPDYARPTSRQIFRSVAPSKNSLIYAPRGWFTTLFGPLVIHRPTMEPGTDRGRRFRGEIAFHAVRSPSVHFEADPPRPGIRATSAGNTWEST